MSPESPGRVEKHDADDTLTGRDRRSALVPPLNLSNTSIIRPAISGAKSTTKVSSRYKIRPIPNAPTCTSIITNQVSPSTFGEVLQYVNRKPPCFFAKDSAALAANTPQAQHQQPRQLAPQDCCV